MRLELFWITCVYTNTACFPCSHLISLSLSLCYYHHPTLIIIAIIGNIYIYKYIRGQPWRPTNQPTYKSEYKHTGTISYTYTHTLLFWIGFFFIFFLFLYFLALFIFFSSAEFSTHATHANSCGPIKAVIQLFRFWMCLCVIIYIYIYIKIYTLRWVSIHKVIEHYRTFFSARVRSLHWRSLAYSGRANKHFCCSILCILVAGSRAGLSHL